jgi:hypothetical protein
LELYIENFPGVKILFEVFFYFIILTYILRSKVKSRRDQEVFLLLFLFKIVVGILFYITRDNAFGVYTGNDELVYYDIAKKYFDLAEFPVFAIFDMNKGFIIYDWIHFSVFNEANIMFVIVTNVFISILTWVIFFNELRKLFAERVTFVIIFLSLIPEVMFFNFQNMRDTLILFFVVSFVKASSNYLKYRKINYLYLFFLAYVTAALRFYNLIIEAIILLLSPFFSNTSGKLKVVILGVILYSLIIVLHPGILNTIWDIFTNFREMVMLNIKSHSDYDFYLLPQFIASDLYTNSLILKVFLTFIVTPDPYTFFDLRLVEQTVIISNLLFLSLIYYFMKELVAFKKLDNIEKIMIIFVVLYTIVILLSPYLSDYRHRGEIMPFIFILIFKNIFKNKSKLPNIIFVQFFTLLVLFIGIGVLR